MVTIEAHPPEDEPRTSSDVETSTKGGASHMRPRVRNRSSKATTAKETNSSHQDPSSSSPQPPFVPPKQSTTKGILKHNSRYTSQSQEGDATTTTEEDEENTPSFPIVQPTIVERKVHRRKDRHKHNQKSKNTSSPSPLASSVVGAIEGHVPTISFAAATDHHNTNKDDEDLVFDSLTDLMAQAGTLPSPQEAVEALEQEGTMVEADLEFTVVSPEEFAAQMDDQEEGQADRIIMNDNDMEPGALEENPAYSSDKDDDDDSEKENVDTDSEEGGSFWDVVLDQGGDEPVETRPERAFLVLWKALSQWVTPQAVAYVLAQREPNDESDAEKHYNSPNLASWSDIESTRCAGVMSLLQLYLGSCLQDDLQRPLQERRTVEQKLGRLIRCFDYTQPSPPMGAHQARALTCLLLQTVQPEYSTTTVPPSCQAVGLSPEEYRYLVQSALVRFQSGGEDGP